MAKIKKTPEQKAADLQALIGGGSISTLQELAQQTKAETSAPAPAPAKKVEQEGEKAPAIPEIVADLPAQTPAPTQPAPEAVAPVSVPNPAPALEITQPATPTAAPGPTRPEPQSSAPAPAPASPPAVVEVPVSTVAVPPAAPALAVVSKPSDESEVTAELDVPATTPEGEEVYDILSLFLKTPERKHIVARLSQRHYDYLNSLGTILGNRATVPDVLYNLIEHFIVKHDKQAQKAIAKQMRLLQKVAMAQPKKS